MWRARKKVCGRESWERAGGREILRGRERKRAGEKAGEREREGGREIVEGRGSEGKRERREIVREGKERYSEREGKREC